MAARLFNCSRIWRSSLSIWPRNVARCAAALSGGGLEPVSFLRVIAAPPPLVFLKAANAVNLPVLGGGVNERSVRPWHLVVSRLPIVARGGEILFRHNPIPDRELRRGC